MLTGEQYYSNKAGHLALQGLFRTGATPAEINSHIDNMIASALNPERKVGLLPAIEETDDLQAKVEAIKEKYRADGADNYHVDSLTQFAVAAETMRGHRELIAAAEESINTNANAGFEKAHKERDALRLEMKVANLQSERRDTQASNLLSATLLAMGFPLEAVELLAKGATEENFQSANALRGRGDASCRK